MCVCVMCVFICVYGEYTSVSDERSIVRRAILFFRRAAQLDGKLAVSVCFWGRSLQEQNRRGSFRVKYWSVERETHNLDRKEGYGLLRLVDIHWAGSKHIAEAGDHLRNWDQHRARCCARCNFHRCAPSFGKRCRMCSNVRCNCANGRFCCHALVPADSGLAALGRVLSSRLPSAR